ncbi:MAG: alpha/beta fold hydrolase [Thiohalocapsa sp.]|nr:alpha/beta fold hydrolase [Thiohalocapsa sp.]
MPGYAAEQAGRPGAARYLLLHGFTGDHRDWRPWPAAGAPALAVDLPGHGRSPDPVGDYGDEIARLLSALPPSIDHLIGYSLGGRLALSLLAAAPHRFAAATIVSAHPGLEKPAERAARAAADRRWIRLLRNQGIAAFVDVWEGQPLFASQRALPLSARRRQRAGRLSQRAEGLARNLECFGLAQMPSTWSALAAYPGRLEWVVGERDDKFVSLALALRRRRPRTVLHRLPGVGHNILLEAPERLIEIVSAH